MDFWEAKRRARGRTALYISLFVLFTVGVAILIEYLLRSYAEETEERPIPFVGLAFLIITFVVALFYMARFSSQGGSAVAESVGAVQIDADIAHPSLKRLYNVVQEMSIAASLPMPKVYLLDTPGINAFAAGTRPDNAAITVTRGALETLSRDELQGVIAHEFSHVANADMLLNMRLAAMIMGFFIVFYIGIRLGEIAFLSRGGRGNGGGGGQAFALIAIAFLLAGALTWFVGAILRSTVSRQREYLADASAVQYTRNPDGIAGALRKIANEEQQAMPKRGMGYSHLYFSNQSLFGRLFATHPPLAKRIEAIEGKRFLNDDLQVTPKKK